MSRQDIKNVSSGKVTQVWGSLYAKTSIKGMNQMDFSMDGIISLY